MESQRPAERHDLVQRGGNAGTDRATRACMSCLPWVPPGGVEPVPGPSVVPDGLPSNALTAAVQGIAGKPDDMKRIHDLDRGSSLAAAVWNPVNPSIATTSTPSVQTLGRPPSQDLKTCVERPSILSGNRAGPVPSRTGVRPMITVTYLSPFGVCRHPAVSGAPVTADPHQQRRRPPARRFVRQRPRDRAGDDARQLRAQAHRAGRT